MPLLAFGLAMDILYKEAPLLSEVVFSMYEFLDDMDSREKFLTAQINIKAKEI